jgi:hypothetical protein
MLCKMFEEIIVGVNGNLEPSLSRFLTSKLLVHRIDCVRNW